LLNPERLSVLEPVAAKRRTLAFEAYRRSLQALTDYLIASKVPPNPA